MQKIENKEKPLWLKTDYAEVEALTIKLAKQGLSSEKIGTMLRDSYGIPTTRLYKIKISDILRKAGINQEPQELVNLKKKVEMLEKHTISKKQDKVGKRSLHITKDRLKRAETYYKKSSS